MMRLFRRSASPSKEAVLAAAVLQLADRYDAASRGEPVHPPTPAWLGEIAAELRGLTQGAVL